MSVGSITMEDLISVLPFGGTFDLVQLKGSTLRKAFEFSVRRYGQATGEFLQVSGKCYLQDVWVHVKMIRCVLVVLVTGRWMSEGDLEELYVSPQRHRCFHVVSNRCPRGV